MTQVIPSFIPFTFILTVIIAIAFFYRIVSISNIGERKYHIIIGVIVWLGLQGFLSYNLFYLETANNIPPPFTFLGFIPTFILIAFLFFADKGRSFIDSLPIYELTLLSLVRIPVEIVLYWLSIETLIPEAMTFHGANFDILAGITAPFVAFFGFRRSSLSKSILLTWNILSLMLLITIILLSVFSFPSFIQQYSFDQPNIGMLHFPFFWLPSFIVPFVFFSHLVSIRRLTLKTK